MKKVFLGLLVAAIAVGGSAFTNAKKATVETFYYKLNQAGTTYTLVGTEDPSGDCNTSNIAKCVIGFSSDQGPSLSRTSLPTTPVYQSTSIGYIN